MSLMEEGGDVIFMQIMMAHILLRHDDT